MRKIIFSSFLLLFCFEVSAQDEAKGVMVECEYSQKQMIDWQNFRIAYPTEETTAPTAVFEATYIDTPIEATRAIQRAIDTWGKLLVSKMPIRVNINWSGVLGARTLASAGPTKIYRNQREFPYKNTWYFVALAEAIAERELNDGAADIDIKINANIDWYFGGNAVIRSSQFDLETVILHEIAHAVGVSSSFSISANSRVGQWGDDDKDNPSPYIYDSFINDSKSQQLINPKFYQNASEELKTQLTTSNLFFDFKKGDLVGKPLRIYAPITFAKGSSLSHFDERSFLRGTPDALMTPFVSANEVVRQPGVLLLNCLMNMGWEISTIKNARIPVKELVVYPNPFEDLLTIQLPETANVFQKVEVIDMLGKVVLVKSAIQDTIVEIQLSDLPRGVYILRVFNGETVEDRKIVK